MKKSKTEIDEFIDRLIYQIKNGIENYNWELTKSDINLEMWDFDILEGDSNKYYFSKYPFEKTNNNDKSNIKLIFFKEKHVLVLIHESKSTLAIKVFESWTIDEIYQFIGKHTMDVHFTDEHFLPFGKWLVNQVNEIKNFIEN
ncbi:hypothetical protein ADIS_4210 [Lunatimonas lonarensis]|uniref:Uncharacterized protein n=1 Tax=Lunatimonas lonarensis TaxID=1232681 RepID=R7ZMJ2_9BACT|nr:hypothetical protein [Lunatimonas lonarensis]EON75297.1 hypothetical protein ADIS_4210 [Lunatimonas lonarensis]